RTLQPPKTASTQSGEERRATALNEPLPLRRGQPPRAHSTARVSQSAAHAARQTAGPSGRQLSPSKVAPGANDSQTVLPSVNQEHARLADKPLAFRSPRVHPRW